MQYNIECRDVLDWAAAYDGEPFHALLTDAPYEYGFMGKSWDASGISYQVETWAALAEHLLPGAFLITFGGARSWHRIAVAIEDAGLIMHPSIFGWAYGSGFPKATRIDTQIDKRSGASVGWFGPWLKKYREDHGIKQKELAKYFPSKTGGLTGCVANWELGLNSPTNEQFNILVEALNLSFESLEEAEREVMGKAPWTNSAHHFVPGENHKERVHLDITAPATDLAAQWQSHRYGLQAMKPALEPILLFQKPWKGKRLDCIVETGAGALNIDQSRIGTDGKDAQQHQAEWDRQWIERGGEIYGKDKGTRDGNGATQGRWPANFALCHSPECKRDGVRRVKGQPPRKTSRDNGVLKFGGDNARPHHDTSKRETVEGYADPDGTETVANWVCVEECPIKALGEQSGESVKGGNVKEYCRKTNEQYSGKFPNNTAIFTRDRGTAARFFHNADWSHEVAEQLAEADPVRYQAKAAKRGREAGLFGIIGCPECGGLETETHVNEHGRTVTCRRNDHNTVKPITLTQWLATLLLPPDAYAPRRILVPFAGSGSEAIGAMLAGWEHITLVEMSDEYCDIARARLAWWTEQAHGQMWPEVKEILKRI